jgi:hypothetical protein
MFTRENVDPTLDSFQKLAPDGVILVLNQAVRFRTQPVSN